MSSNLPSFIRFATPPGNVSMAARETTDWSAAPAGYSRCQDRGAKAQHAYSSLHLLMSAVLMGFNVLAMFWMCSGYRWMHGCDESGFIDTL